MANKTLPKEYVIANKEVQEQFYFIYNGGKVDDISNAHAFIEKLPVLNKKSVRVLNRKGQMIAIVSKKGGMRTFNADYNRKTWYFDGNRLGKRKRLLVEAFYNESLIETINQDGLEKVWKKISHRVNF